MARDITKLYPDLQTKAALLILKCAEQGISIKIGECVRTLEEQNALYAKGRTAPGKKVTNAKGSSYSSMHQWGVAFDFYLDEDVDGDGKKSDDAYNNKTALFDKVGKIGQSIGLEWGGDWKSLKDRPHFQLPNWGSTPSKLKALYKTPGNFFRTWETLKKEIPVQTSVTQPSVTCDVDGNYTLEEFVFDVCTMFGATTAVGVLNKTITLSSKKNPTHKCVILIKKYMKAYGLYRGDVTIARWDSKLTEAVVAYQRNYLGMKKPDGEITAGKGMWKEMLKIK